MTFGKNLDSSFKLKQKKKLNENLIMMRHKINQSEQVIMLRILKNVVRKKQLISRRRFSKIPETVNRFEKIVPNKNLYPFNHQFQVLSDIHLDNNEFKTYQVLPTAPYLIIAGDLANPYSLVFWNFMKDNCHNFKRVFFVPGNHEFYDHQSELTRTIDSPDYQDIGKRLRELELEFPKLTVLMKDRYDLELETGPVSLLGTTLWSHIPEDAWPHLGHRMTDYLKIRYLNRKLTPNDTNLFHQKEKEWLIQELTWLKCQEPTRKTLVVTHHAPLIEGTCHPRYYRDDDGKVDRIKWCNYAFCTDLSHELLRPFRPTAWVFGHTHYRCRFQDPESGTVLVNNPLGVVKKPYQIVRTI